MDASECPPTFGTPFDMVQGIMAGGPAAMFKAQEGAEDRLDTAGPDLEAAGMRAGDFVIGIAASGTTPYVRAALMHAKQHGAHTAIVACSPPPQATLDWADIAIVTVTGPEALTGSTRMKAGTATKLVLNTITTGAMIRLGKTFGNLMIDLRATKSTTTAAVPVDASSPAASADNATRPEKTRLTNSRTIDLTTRCCGRTGA